MTILKSIKLNCYERDFIVKKCFVPAEYVKDYNCSDTWVGESSEVFFSENFTLLNFIELLLNELLEKEESDERVRELSVENNLLKDLIRGSLR